jgi:hypothetical protein
VYTKRQLQEIYLCLFYAETTVHGTDGHNSKLIVTQSARKLGFSLVWENNTVNLYYGDRLVGGGNVWPMEELTL